MLRVLGIKGVRNPLASDGHQMDCAVSKIDNLLGMPKRERSVISGPNVASICTDGGVTKLNGRCHRAVTDRTSEAAISHALELLIPSRGWHPHFDSDIGIAGWSEGGRYATERWHIREDLTVGCGV